MIKFGLMFQRKSLNGKIFTRSVADHNIVSCVVRIKGNPKTNQDTLKRNWKNVDLNLLKLKIKNKNWNEVYTFEDPELAYNSLEEKILEVLDELIPVQKKKKKNHHK